MSIIISVQVILSRIIQSNVLTHDTAYTPGLKQQRFHDFFEGPAPVKGIL